MKALIAGLVTLAVTYCLIGSVSGWGAITQQYICEKSLAKSAGPDILETCFGENEQIDTLCDLVRDNLGEEEYQKCILTIGVHPWTLPYTVLNDTEDHYDYSLCPIPEHEVITWRWVCDPSKATPALTNANFWFNVSKNEEDSCRRAYAFCLGANYFSDRFLPAYEMRYITDASKAEMELGVDQKLLGDQDSWSFSTLTRIQQNTRKTTIRTYISDTDIKAIIESLSTVYTNITNSKRSQSNLAHIEKPNLNITHTENIPDEPPSSPVEPIQVTEESRCQTDTDCMTQFCDNGTCMIPTCTDGKQNQREKNIDCGGPCSPCPTCTDSIKNQDEERIDCGGVCSPCEKKRGDLVSIARVIPVMPEAMIGLVFLFCSGFFLKRFRRAKPQTPEKKAQPVQKKEPLTRIKKQLQEKDPSDTPSVEELKKALDDIKKELDNV